MKSYNNITELMMEIAELERKKRINRRVFFAAMFLLALVTILSSGRC